MPKAGPNLSFDIGIISVSYRDTVILIIPAEKAWPVNTQSHKLYLYKNNLNAEKN